jgi:hypothetical protein
VVEERSLEREVAIEEKFEVSEDVRRVREIWGEEWKKIVRENRENELRLGISGVVVMVFVCAWEMRGFLFYFFIFIFCVQEYLLEEYFRQKVAYVSFKIYWQKFLPLTFLFI